MRSILILMHTESNTGFAINTLEAVFFRMALELCEQDASRIHFAYPSMQKGPTEGLPGDFRRYLILDSRAADRAECEKAARYISDHGIDLVFGCDQPVHRPIYKYLRRAGVRHFISYWGAPMSSLSGKIRLGLKRLEVVLRTNGPDHYIFESNGMAQRAILGRGIPARRTSVVHTGIDLNRYSPRPEDADYVYRALAIPGDEPIFFYSGHMEKRKGVQIIMQAANLLSATRPDLSWHVVLCGNRPGEEVSLARMLGPAAAKRVLFAGYRNDLPLLQRGCYAGVIASTGWDSFPMSAIEMQASGLPVIVSDLPGISETIAEGESGLAVPAGDAQALCEAMIRLLVEPALRERLSQGARDRAERLFSRDRQRANLVSVVNSVVGGRRIRDAMLRHGIRDQN